MKMKIMPEGIRIDLGEYLIEYFEIFYILDRNVQAINRNSNFLEYAVMD